MNLGFLVAGFCSGLLFVHIIGMVKKSIQRSEELRKRLYGKEFEFWRTAYKTGFTTEPVRPIDITFTLCYSGYGFFFPHKIFVNQDDNNIDEIGMHRVVVDCGYCKRAIIHVKVSEQK